MMLQKLLPTLSMSTYLCAISLSELAEALPLGITRPKDISEGEAATVNSNVNTIFGHTIPMSSNPFRSSWYSADDSEHTKSNAVDFDGAGVSHADGKEHFHGGVIQVKV